ncbi:Abi family protein [Rodentibacter sp. Ppn85]|uniref:Abi family protein n=1 Tax=Rodentibacter sp. Ppn85 TaxID=1908525 RepID=UPI0018EA0492|nr:Abi family protein [Rodentibacter sp. Ppn85]
MVKEIKSWKDYKDLLELLISRGMGVECQQQALHYLENIGYYRLSGYWHPFRQKNELQSQQKAKLVLLDDFKPDTYFSTVLNLYIFDKKLRLLALDALERIEMAVRNDVVHLLGKLHPLAHIEPHQTDPQTRNNICCLHPNFVNTDKYVRWKEKHNKLVERAKNRESIKHYMKQYGGVLPIWVSAEVWDFGLLSQLFAGMRFHDKNMIAKKYGVKHGKTLEQWLKSLNFIRNVCAHHGRLWNLNIVNTAAPLDDFVSINQYRVFMYLVIMQKMLLTINPKSTWNKRLYELLKSFPNAENGAISIQDMGYPKIGKIGKN